MTAEPRPTRAVRFPAEYGKPGGAADRLPWSFVDERLRAASNYWITTVTDDGRPHARPLDGVWVDGALCFGGSPETRWVRNLQANPALSAHLSSETEAVILEGRAEFVTDPGHPLVAPSNIATRAKYPQYYANAPDGDAEFQPFWALRPRRVYAWTLAGFPRRSAAWSFD